jgi:prepilin-type N-terminal cleavage/methylation domain-containing protein
MMKSPSEHGFTLIELLIAMAIFGVVMTLAYSGIVSALRVQSDQEVVTSAQARLRRVVEVVTQDIRSAVFGSVTASPYASGQTSISFMLLSGAAGFPVESSANFSLGTSSTIAARSAEASLLAGKRVVMVNGTGQGVVYTVGSVTDLGNNRFQLNHGSCRNTIDYSGGVQLFEISQLGLRYDSGDRTIYQSANSVDEQPLAFNVDDFRLEYTYNTGAASASNPTIVRSSPFMNGGVPTRKYVDGNGFTYILDRVQMVISSVERSNGRDLERTYSGYVDLSSNSHFTLMEVLPCS